jgi:hypothetical protein
MKEIKMNVVLGSHDIARSYIKIKDGRTFLISSVNLSAVSKEDFLFSFLSFLTGEATEGYETKVFDMSHEDPFGAGEIEVILSPSPEECFENHKCLVNKYLEGGSILASSDTQNLTYFS